MGHRNPRSEILLASNDDDDFAELSKPELDEDQRSLLLLAAHFLVMIQQRDYLRTAAKHGYTSREHQLGWRLLRAAGGEERPLEHWFGVAESGAAIGKHAGIADALDELARFRERWTLRIHAIIQRHVDEELQGSFTQAFFAPLSEQRIGPTIVANARQLIRKIRELERSSQLMAQTVRRVLEARGLSEVLLRRMEDLIEEVVDATGEEQHSSEVILQHRLVQQHGFDQLQKWLNDWHATLHDVFSESDCQKLGIQRPERRSLTPSTGATSAFSLSDPVSAVQPRHT